MYQSLSSSRDETLLVDIEQGTVLAHPAAAVVSTRYVESHPFIERATGNASGAGFIVAGPDASLVAAGFGGRDYVLYRIDSEVAGTLRLTRES